LLNTVIGVLAGLVVAGAVLLLREYLDDTIASAEDVEAAAALPTLGAVARFPKNARSGLVISSPRRMAAAEAYRVLRTNMRFATLDESAQAIVISSASPGEGKTTTTANLAVAIAQTGQRVIAVDSDLRRPSLHRIFGLGNGAGLTSALISREPQIEQMLQATQFGQLSILSSGPIPPNPSELLSSKRMDAVIQALRRQADIVLFDSPPVLAVADAAIVAGKVDGAMLVVDAGRARSAAVRRAAEALRRSKTKVVGAVLNKLTDRSLGGYQDYHYYSSYVSPSGSNGRRADADGRRDVKEPKEAAVA
jgi:non-specific protein-tyrosine kinase